MTYCKCGCKTEIVSTRAFAPGHDLRAALKIITARYGSIEAFVDAQNAYEVNALEQA